MYIVNDINKLLDLIKLLKVHERLPNGSLAVSKLKLLQHALTTKQQLRAYTDIAHLNIDSPELFETWRAGKTERLSGGDLSSVYIALKNHN